MREQDLCKVLAPVSAPMIEIAEGNILDADADALVNTVNCAGVMGKGLALQFKQAFPANFKAYEAACRAREVVAGTMFIFDNGLLVKPRYIVNFPTKRHWRDNWRIEDIRSGLESLIAERASVGHPLDCRTAAWMRAWRIELARRPANDRELVLRIARRACAAVSPGGLKVV